MGGAVYATQMAHLRLRAVARNTSCHYLLAMSTAHDFRKCYALASLFACGHKSLVSLHTKKISTELSALIFFCGAVTET